MKATSTRDAFMVGLAQLAALVPGVSRSGATIGAGYRLGLAPAGAARFSFLALDSSGRGLRPVRSH